MVSPISYLTTMKDPEYVETWLKCFTVLARVKKLKGTKSSGGVNELMDLFLASARCEALKKKYHGLSQSIG